MQSSDIFNTDVKGGLRKKRIVLKGVTIKAKNGKNKRSSAHFKRRVFRKQKCVTAENGSVDITNFPTCEEVSREQ